MSIIRINRLNIHDFRCFQNINFKLGKYITVIAGQNATGKSTILGLLGHCAELKKKDGKPILKNQFRTEFSEIIKASLEFDRTISPCYSIQFSTDENGSEFTIAFRSTWQSYKKNKRFRLIPKKTPERKTEKKLEWPTLYLGLSRLYPIGESELPKTSVLRLPSDKKALFLKNHKEILSLNEDPVDCSEITIKETPKKTVGIKTNKYDPITNSAGQDNISQILLAVMSFELLKEQQGENWQGGLLLIDEVDATLHPAAQNKLVKFLYDTAKKLQIQVVFTTHSLSLLEFLCEKTEHNDPEQINLYELIYFTTRNQYLEMLENPDYQTIYYDMLNTLSILHPDSRKVTVYTEDDEARWFLKKLLGPRCAYIKLPNIKLGCDELLKLVREDYSHFKNILFVLDGDVEKSKIEEISKSLGFKSDWLPNVITLPGDTFPEKVIFNYLKNTPGEHELFQNELAATGLSKRTVEEHGPSSFTQYQKERDQYKHWFNEFLLLLENVYPYWERDNEGIVKKFQQKFEEAFNEIAKRIGAPKFLRA
ncbi:MAG: hypothetical protein PWQ60_1907 [Thermoanaerobacteraceae bacterium]|nr:hypothetical protein [Thermoanaerobacteraceae bacterium]